MQQLTQDEDTGKQAEAPVSQELKERTRPPAHSGLPHHGKIFFFGVILPILAVLFETTFHFCARHFFDPFPSANHVVLFLLIPLSNYLTLLASHRNLSAHYSFMSLASGMAMGMGAMYSLMFLPLLGSSLFFVGAFGFGLLGLAPALSLPCTWLTSKKVCHLSSQRKTYFNPHQVEHIGHLIILVMVLAVELPSTLTRVYLGIAANPATATDGVRWLRKYGSEEVMLRACYERSGRATDIIGSVYEAGHPLAVSDARRIFYQVTGKPFNSVPIPASARATIQHALASDPGGLNAKVEDEFDLDTDIAGETVSGVSRGLSVASSSYSGKIDADAMLAELDWSFSFSNVSKYDREARSKILLPPGAVVTRATLTIDNQELDATIMVREAARQYYQQAILQHKDDPLLVSTCGVDQVLVQCYPVHPDSNLKVKLSIVCPLAFDANSDGALSLPTFAEKNFQADAPSRVSLESALPLSVSGLRVPVESKQDSAGNKTKWLLNTKLDASDLARFAPIIHSSRHHDCNSVFCHDRFASPPVVLERLIRKPHYKAPQKLVILLDGSVSMKEQMPEIIRGLASLPPSIPSEIVLLGDEKKTLCTDSILPSSPEYQRVIERLEAFKPAGGQDNSMVLLNVLSKARTEAGSSVLWIHGAQPINSAANMQPINSFLHRNSPEAKGLTVFATPPQHGLPVESIQNNLEQPLLYDLQVNAGPVAILQSMQSCAGFKRVEPAGSAADDLHQLYQNWQSAPESAVNEFVVHTEAGVKPTEPAPIEASPALAQLFAYKRIMRDLEYQASAPANEPNVLSSQYHLITPVSSAVVTDTRAKLTPLPKPEPNQLSEFFSARTIETAYAQTSRDLNDSIDGASRIYIIALHPGMLIPFSFLSGTLSSSIDQSFSTTVNQLNRLNAVTNAGGSGGSGYSSYNYSGAQTQQEQYRPAAPMLQGATNGTIGPQGENASVIQGVNTAGIRADKPTFGAGAGGSGDAFDSSGARGGKDYESSRRQSVVMDSAPIIHNYRANTTGEPTVQEGFGTIGGQIQSKIAGYKTRAMTPPPAMPYSTTAPPSAMPHSMPAMVRSMLKKDAGMSQQQASPESKEAESCALSFDYKQKESKNEIAKAPLNDELSQVSACRASSPLDSSDRWVWILDFGIALALLVGLLKSSRMPRNFKK